MIAIITHNYPSKENLVAGLFVADHEEKIRRERGVPVRVFNYPFGEFPMTKAMKNPLKWPKFLKYHLGTPAKIKRDIEEWVAQEGGQLEEIIAHWWIPNGLFAVKHFDNVHVICHGTDLYLLQKFPWAAGLFTKGARRVRSWQCVSNDLKRTLLKHYPFIDEKTISVEPMPWGRMFVDKKLPRDKNLIVSVGALIERKNFDRLISEVARVPDAKLGLYGQGPEKDKLERLITDLGVSDRISLAGQVTREELAEVYNRASLFVLLSRDEGFGLVLKESQACGCKTMAYVGDGMADTGLDYPIQRDEPVAERIREVLADTSSS